MRRRAASGHGYFSVSKIAHQGQVVGKRHARHRQAPGTDSRAVKDEIQLPAGRPARIRGRAIGHRVGQLVAIMNSEVSRSPHRELKSPATVCGLGVSIAREYRSLNWWCRTRKPSERCARKMVRFSSSTRSPVASRPSRNNETARSESYRASRRRCPADLQSAAIGRCARRGILSGSSGSFPTPPRSPAPGSAGRPIRARVHLDQPHGIRIQIL